LAIFKKTGQVSYLKGGTYVIITLDMTALSVTIDKDQGL